MSFTPVIEHRYRLMFRFFDLNKDGLLDSKDFEILIDNVAQVFKTDATENVKALSGKWWGMFDKLGLQGTITEQQFISAIRFLLERDFEKFRKLHFKWYEKNFDLVDRNRDNRISLDELVEYYACFGITDTDRVKKVFNRLDLDKSGFLTREEWILARLDFISRDDPDYDYGFMNDFSLPVPENSGSGRLTPNLLKRYKLAFQFYDVNKDGFLTLADFLMFCENMCILNNLGEEEKAALEHSMHESWKHLLPKAINGKITEEQYVYMAISGLVTDFDQFRLDIILNYRPWFKIADHDNDGVISEDEFVRCYAAYGKTNKDKVKLIFKKIDQDEDGFIGEEEWILAFVDFWTRDDPNYDYGFMYYAE